MLVLKKCLYGVLVCHAQGRYGTRSTAALTVTDGGEVNFYEMYLESEKWREQTVTYQIAKPKKMDAERMP